MSFTSDLALVVADGVSALRTGGVWQLSMTQRPFRGNRYTLAVLDAFSTEKRVERGVNEAAASLQSTSAWIEIVATVRALYDFGILVEPGSDESVGAAHVARFDSAPVHIRMLNDEVRTTQFQAALRTVVRAGDVVVDIGTCTGVLAITAAMAGARHVYALEATAMSRYARQLVEANGFSDTVTVIEAHSFDVELPERADVLVSEIIGDDPLGEAILPTFADARRRLLSEGARAIPAALQIHVLPVEAPDSVTERSRFTPEMARRWGSRFGFDFAALATASAGQEHRIKLNSYETRGWRRLSAPVTVADIDLLHAPTHLVDGSFRCQATDDGSLSGVLIFFTADLAPGVRLSIHPDDATPANSWGSVLQLLRTPMSLTAGDEFELRYHYDDRGSRVAVERCGR